MPKCEIESVKPLSKDKLNPVIVNFQNATPMEENHEVSYVVNKEKKPGLFIEYQGKLQTNYYGKIGENYSTDLVSTYIAIRNKETNKIRCVEVEQCCVLSEHYHQTPYGNEMSMAIDSRSLLYKNFGSKKAVRAMDKKEKTAFNVDILKDNLDTSVLDVDESVLMDESVSSIEVEEIRPKYNKDAEKAEDVYDLEEIIPKKIMVNLEKPALSLLAIKSIHFPFTLPFVLNIVKEVQMSKEPDSTENLRKLKICIYLDALANIINTKSRFLSKIEISKVSDQLSKHIRQTFTNDTRHDVRSKFTEQKAICYFLVLSCLLSRSLEVNVVNAIEGLNITKKDIAKYIAYIGASSKQKTGTIKIRLPKDLPSPGSMKRFEKRRKQ